MRDMLLRVVWCLSNTEVTEIAPTKSAVSFNTTYVHIQSVSPTEECGWKRTWGVKSSINKYSTTIELVFTFDWPLCNHILLHFPHWSWFIKLSAGQCMVRSLSKIKPVKWVPPKYSPKGRKNWKFRRALEGVTIEVVTYFDSDKRVFWGGILWI